jgi:hypothetical protein
VAVDVLTDDGMGDRDPVSAFYCTTSGCAFGPTMLADKDEVYGFQHWLRHERDVEDERLIDHDKLAGHWYEWIELTQEQKDKHIEATY